MNILENPRASLTLFLGLSLAAILTALAFEHLGGYEPCPLCLQERYAYYFAIPLSAAALATLSNNNSLALGLIAIAGLGYLINSGLGVYHSGVEWKWWAGPSACSGAANLAPAAGNLLQSLETIRVIRCDEAPWRLFGLSFAGWNAIISFFLFALSLSIIKGLRSS